MAAAARIDSHPSIKWWDFIPKETPKAVAQSFLGSLSAAVILSGGKIAVGLWKGSAAIVATLIDALTRPLFNLFFSTDQVETYKYWFVKMVVVCTAMQVILPLMAPLFGLTGTISFAMLPVYIAMEMIQRVVAEAFGWPPAPIADAQYYWI